MPGLVRLGLWHRAYTALNFADIGDSPGLAQREAFSSLLLVDLGGCHNAGPRRTYTALEFVDL